VEDLTTASDLQQQNMSPQLLQVHLMTRYT